MRCWTISVRPAHAASALVITVQIELASLIERMFVVFGGVGVTLVSCLLGVLAEVSGQLSELRNPIA